MQASGNIGVPLIAKLHDAGFQVSALSRIGSKATYPSYVNNLFVDYESSSSLCKALLGHDAVVSCLGALARQLDDNLVEAASSAGVKRFVPAIYTGDMRNGKSRVLAMNIDPVAIQEKLIEKSKQEGGISFSFVLTGGFLEMSLTNGFVMDLKAGVATIYDGGDRVVNFTTIDTIAKSIVACLVHSEETKNCNIYVSEVATTQNRILALAKMIDPNKEWVLSEARSVEAEKQADENFRAGRTDLWSLMGSLIRMYFGGPQYGMPFLKLDNKVLGIDEIGEKGLEKVIKTIIEG